MGTSAVAPTTAVAPSLVVVVVVLFAAAPMLVDAIVAATPPIGGGVSEDHLGVPSWRPYGIGFSAVHPPPFFLAAEAADALADDAVPLMTLAMLMLLDFVGVIAIGSVLILGPSARPSASAEATSSSRASSGRPLPARRIIGGVDDDDDDASVVVLGPSARDAASAEATPSSSAKTSPRKSDRGVAPASAAARGPSPPASPTPSEDAVDASPPPPPPPDSSEDDDATAASAMVTGTARRA